MEVCRQREQEEVARSAVLNASELLLQVPLQWAALLEGVNPKTFLANVTGISKSRIAEGALDQLRPSSLRRAEEHAQQLARERAREAGFSEIEFEDVRISQPRLDDGLPSCWGGVFHVWSKLDGVELAETINHAVALETFVLRLHSAATAGDWVAARHAAQMYFSSDKFEPFDLGVSISSLDAVNGWGHLRPLLDRVLIEAYGALFATFDVEWCAQYFRSLRAQPVLLWLSPQVDLDPEGKLRRRNGIRRPVRKLLELSYVIAERGHSGLWPSKAPGRSEVGAILEQSDAHVGNYFDGTRKLTLKAFDTWWVKLTSTMRQRFGRDDQMAAPMMLARVALLWQDYWVKEAAGKPRSVIVLNQADYRRRWQAIRRRLSAKYPEGQDAWPAWLTAQSSSSPDLSSQSSGRSS